MQDHRRTTLPTRLGVSIGVLLVLPTCAACTCLAAPPPGAAAGVTVLRHSKQVNALAFRGDGKLLAVGDEEGIVHLWNLDTKLRTAKLGNAYEPLDAITFAREGRLLITSSAMGDTRIWDLHSLRQTNDVELGANAVLPMKDGKTLVLGDQHGGHYLDLSKAAVRGDRILPTDTEILAMSPNEQLVASRSSKAVSGPYVVTVWKVPPVDRKAGQQAQRLRRVNGGACAAFSRDSNLLVVGDGSYHLGPAIVSVQSLGTGRDIAVWDIGKNGITYSVACSPTDDYVACAGDAAFLPKGSEPGKARGFLQLRSLKTGELLSDLPESEAVIRFVAFSADGKRFATGDEKGFVRVYEVQNVVRKAGAIVNPKP